MYRVKKISCENPLNENNFTKSSIKKKKKMNRYFSSFPRVISISIITISNRQICHKPTLPITRKKKKYLNRPSYFSIFLAISVSINYQLITNAAKQTISPISFIKESFIPPRFPSIQFPFP